MNHLETIELFFTAFENLDYRTMNAQYSDDVVYSDPLFGVLQGSEVKNKWELTASLIEDLKLTILQTETLDHEYATCRWKAEYFSTEAGRHIVLEAKSFMKFADGKITEHSDGYSLTKWIAQAYGLKGQLFGWTGSMKRNVQAAYRSRLAKFSTSRNLFNTAKKRRHVSDSFDH